MKATTIPRLELCGALLAARLVKSVREALRCPISRYVHWSDSSVVLGWLDTNSNNLKTFVANRVAEIRELTDTRAWHHVPTRDNPADLISRGVDPSLIGSLSLWWQGPTFLQLSEDHWPRLPTQIQELPEIKVAMAITTPDSIIAICRYSSLSKVQRVMAYILRFVNRNRNAATTTVLSADELERAFHALCKIAQSESFPQERKLLITGKPLSPRNRLLTLMPFVDDTGLIRVGGRLSLSSYTYDKKHPILLDSKHHLTKILFHHQHKKLLHAGPQLLLASLREMVWPINGRNLARQTVRNCVTCRRFNGKNMFAIMGNLPSSRVTSGFPFQTVGIDFAGPFSISSRKGRGSRISKAYLCIFVCFRYKCVHLEAVSELTKDAFILTLNRFIARRGKPSEIFCDNGRNFVAAAKEIGQFLITESGSITNTTAGEGIKFNFSPAYAPHFGGLWEAGVKSAKYHVRRVMGTSHLTFEELSSLFAQVEAILNSRPLCPLSPLPHDLTPLTPGHFLVGRALTALPTADPERGPRPMALRYRRLQELRQHFWGRWRREYIAELQTRTKWRVGQKKLNIGDMVLLIEEHADPLHWRLGRVQQLHPGADGVARVADINTTKGLVRRALNKICPLPSADETQG